MPIFKDIFKHSVMIVLQLLSVKSSRDDGLVANKEDREKRGSSEIKSGTVSGG